MGTRFQPLGVEELERISREQYKRAFPKREGPAPRPRNAASTLIALGAERLAFAFRGVAYELRPVSFEDGLRLAEVRAALDAAADDNRLTPEVAREASRGLRYVVSLAPKYLRPLRWMRRLFWALRLRRNPYRGATAREVGELLGFFLGCRTMSRARFPGT
jgi:hypothetical protein